ncbi:MAG: sulfatase [Pirellulales bacterium]
MTRRRWLNLLLVVALGLVGAAHAGRAAEPATEGATRRHPTNVLMIVVDDLRPSLGCYGDAAAKTPNIDRLAARGVVFKNAYCQQAVCSPSRASLMTGRRPDATQVWDLRTHFRSALPDCVTLPEYFKNQGYRCAAFGKIFHRGFEDGRSWTEPHWYPTGRTVDTDPADWSKQITKKVGPAVEEYGSEEPRSESGKGPAFEISAKADDELPDGFTAAEAIRRLEAFKQGGEPFFLAVGFLKPHLPFVAPKRYWDLHDPDAIPLPRIDHLPEGAPQFAGHDSGELHQYVGIPAGNPLPADIARQLRHGYYACVSYTDAQVGRLLDAVDRAGLTDSTAIVLWGDHGWQLGDHGLWHKHTNFELAARSPLIIAAPGIGVGGGTCAAPVEFVDVYPTLTDICGLPVARGMDGTSLEPLLLDPSGSVKPVAISQYPRGKGRGSDVPVMGYSIRDDRWRLTVWREDGSARVVATELYDERDDPDETRNVAADPARRAVIERLSQHLPPPGPSAAAAAAKSKKNAKGKKQPVDL